MENLIEKVNNLKEELNKEECILNIKRLNKELINNKDLINKIKRYHQTKDDNIKEELYKNSLIKEYKETETDINILIMKINQKLKLIDNKGKCGL